MSNSALTTTTFAISALSDLGITATPTELNYTSGVTSAIQTQLNAKQASLSGTGFVKISGTTISYDNSTYLTSLSGAVLTDQTVGQTIGATGARLTKLWATDITVTNAISGSVTGNAGTATTLATPRAIYGNNFDGSAALTQIIASTYGGTGNGFTKFSGATTSEKTYTLPDSSETLLYAGGALGTPSSGTLTNATGLPISGLVASTSTALGVGSIELGHATDTTLARVSAGIVSIEGVNIVTTSSTDTLTNKTLTTPKFADLGYIADANGNEMIIFDTVTSAVNEITLSNNSTGNRPEITATGGDTNISLGLTTKGSGNLVVSSSTGYISLLSNATGVSFRTTGIHDSSGNIMIGTSKVTSAVNYIDIKNNTTTNKPTITATGSDTNVDMLLIGKGTGKIHIGDSTDNTKLLTFDLSGATTAKKMTITSSHTNDRTITLPDVTGTLVTTGSKLSVFAATTSSELAGVISDETGSGSLVFATSPTLVTPVLGVATATSINKMAITAPATSSTLAVADGKTFTASNTITLTGTDTVSMNVSNNKLTSVGFTIDGGGSAISTGKVKGFFTCPYAGTISAFNIVVDTGTVTVKVWKIATGTAKPTSANSINTSGVALSTGTALHSTTLSDFTSTTVTANDIFAFNIEAVSGVTEMSFNLEITRT